MTDLTKKLMVENEDINPNTEEIAKTIQSAALNDELTDSVISGEGYSIRGNLTEDVLTDGSRTRGALAEEPLIIESSERGTLEDEDITEGEINNDTLP